MIRPEAVLFDLDGTLVDSHGSIRAALVATLAAHGRVLDEALFEQGMSRPLRAMLEVHAPEAGQPELDSLVDGYLTAYVRTMIPRSPPFPGVVELLDALRAGGARLAVVTNKTEENARAIVTAHFGARFEAVVGMVPGRPGKPDPATVHVACEALGAPPARAWLVGDSPLDLRAAHAAGAAAIAATWALDEGARAALPAHDAEVATPEALAQLFTLSRS